MPERSTEFDRVKERWIFEEEFATLISIFSSTFLAPTRFGRPTHCRDDENYFILCLIFDGCDSSECIYGIQMHSHYLSWFDSQWANTTRIVVSNCNRSHIQCNVVCDDTIQKRCSTYQPGTLIQTDTSHTSPALAVCVSVSFRVIWIERKDSSSVVGDIFFSLHQQRIYIFTSQVPIQTSLNERKPIFQKNMQKKWNAAASSWRISYYFRFNFRFCSSPSSFSSSFSFVAWQCWVVQWADEK